MEWIFYGIMLAIGFYLAPMIISLIIMLFIVIMAAIIGIFQTIFGGNK